MDGTRVKFIPVNIYPALDKFISGLFIGWERNDRM
jgi:hypothetical protein